MCKDIANTVLSQLDYRKIATMYGNGNLRSSLATPFSTNSTSFSGATYDSIEGRFRIIRKEAAVMKAEVESGARPAAPPRNANAGGSNSGQTTPRKSKTTTKKDKTLTGRVTKSNASTPTKKNANGDLANGIKQEQDSAASSFSIMDEADAEGDEMMDGNAFFDMGDEGY